MRGLIRSLLIFAGICSSAFCGCGGGPTSKYPTVTVTGTVTLDGQPLATGNIAFEPLNGKGSASQGGITAGKFSFESEVGPKLVRVYSVKQTGEKDQYGSEISTELIPSRYNSESSTSVDVTKEKLPSFTFELKTAN